MKQVDIRANQRLEDLWNLSDLFPSLDAWETEFASVRVKVEEVKKFQGNLHHPLILKDCLKLQDEISLSMERLYVFATMWHHEDTSRPEPQGYVDRISKLGTDIGEALSFATPELLSLPDNQLIDLINHPELSFYQPSLDDLPSQKAHTLSAAEEALLAQVGQLAQAPGTTYEMLTNADLQFPEIEDEHGNLVQLTDGNYTQFLESSDRGVRERAFKATYQTYQSFQNTFASTFSGNVNNNVFYARVRKFESPLAQALSSNEIPQSVYTNLIETMHEHLPLFHRYLNLKKRLLKVDELHLYDLFAPVSIDTEPEVVTFEEAKEIVSESLTPLGEDYLRVLSDGFENKWIDVYENHGKYGGAYSWGAYGTHPYVLLNHKETLDSAFTLTHEMGHALHSYFSDQSQPYRYAQYTIFNAEVASTCNEALLMQHLLKHAKSDVERMNLLIHYADQFRGTVFRQTMFAEFEMIVHEMAQRGEPLTAQSISQTYVDLAKKYNGNEVVMDDEIRFEWARIPHFYNSFYVFQYATGFSAATSLSNQILTEGEPAVKRYLEFLSSGSSANSIELLKRAGVDMSTPEPIRNALGVFENVLNQLEEVALKLGVIS